LPSFDSFGREIQQKSVVTHQCSNQRLHQNTIAFMNILPKTINKGPYVLPKVQNELKGKIFVSPMLAKDRNTLAGVALSLFMESTH